MSFVPIFATPAAMAFGGVPIDLKRKKNCQFVIDKLYVSVLYLFKSTYQRECEMPSNKIEQLETLDIVDAFLF